MLYDENGATYDEYMDRMLSEFYEQHGPEIAAEAIDGFQAERLQSYFIKNPRLVEPSLRQLTEARNLQGAGHHDAALVFGASAVEVCLKQALFRPVVHGLVHSEPAAVVIAELSLQHTGIDRFSRLMLVVLAERLQVDLRGYVHTGGTTPLWEEIKVTQEHRNAIVHRAETRSPAEADVAIRCGSAVVESLFPTVVKSLGLHLHRGVQTCNNASCKSTP